MSLDGWQELLERLDRSRLRTGLTMFSVAWGILMLVMLLAAGRGLENNVRWQFRDDAINSIWLWPGRTAVPWKGHPVGRALSFDNDDIDAIRAMPDVGALTGRFRIWDDFAISWGDRRGDFSVRAVHPDHQVLEGTVITSGRYIDDLDLAEKRKVAVIGDEVSSQLFRGEDPIGERIDIGGITYTVVGVFFDDGGPGETQLIYVPITTAQLAYGGGRRVHQIMFTVGDMSVEQSEALTDQVRGQLARAHDFDPDDARALRVRNNLEQFQQVNQMFEWIGAFVWVVGVGTVLAGAVGVSNILLVSVKERTAELGLRKAIGATPGSLVAMILQEAVVLTSVAGYAGLVLGVALVEIVAASLPENEYVRDPSVDLGVLGAAVVLLVVLGTLAGLVPALRAASIDPINALRDG